MTLYSNVAPPKIPLRPKPLRWTCRCRQDEPRDGLVMVLNPGYLVQCPVCKTHRPD